VIKVEANRDTCEGFGTCVLAAEAVFDLDDEGLVVIKQEMVGDDLLGAVRQAAYDCPTESITFVENAGDA
jgi:ferredoxin